MSIGTLGNKIGMTRAFNDKGAAIPVTLIKLKPCFVIEVKTKEKHGYNSVVLSPLDIFKKICKKNKIYRKNSFKEFKTADKESYCVGEKVSLDWLKNGLKLTIQGLTIGKGNSGNIKRNSFNRGPMSHGSKHHRLQGSMGAGTSPGRVFPGKKMPGALGNSKQTIHGLEVFEFIKDKSILAIKGSVPGKAGSLIKIKPSKND